MRLSEQFGLEDSIQSESAVSQKAINSMLDRRATKDAILCILCIYANFGRRGCCLTVREFRFSCRLRVRWSDCDAQGIVFNGMYMSFVEVAQVAYFRNLGIRLYDPEGRKHFDTATVKATLEYVSPAFVDDLLEVRWRIASIGNTSLTSEAEIFEADTGRLVMRAEVVNVDFDAEAVASRRVPDDMRKLIETYEATGVVIPLDDLPGLAGLARV